MGDFNKFKRSFLNTVRMMSSGVHIEDNENTVRGLEGRTREGAFKRKSNKHHGRQAVLCEQDRQRSIGIHNEEMISDAYVNENLKCRLEALEMGIKDQYEVFEELRKINEFDVEEMDLEGMVEDVSSDEELDYCNGDKAAEILSERK